MREVTNRRDFLRTAAISGAALSTVLAQFGSVTESFAASIHQDDDRRSKPDFEALAQNYLLDPAITYLNHASIGTMPKAAHLARQKYLDLCETNPWLYMWGGAWDEMRENVRDQAARFLGCQSIEIAITHNTTEMFNTLAGGLPLMPDDEVLFSSLCHAGASLPFVHREQQGLFKTRRFDFPVDRLPAITSAEVIKAYADQIKPETRALIIPHVDNTVGLRYPVREIAKIAREKGVEFIAVDAAQTVGMLPVDVSEMNVDVVATSPHKWLGAPKGIGLAYISQKMIDVIKPLWVTWGQDRWPGTARIFEDYGTRNLAELLTLGHCIEFNQTITSEARTNRLKALWNHTREQVARMNNLTWTSPDNWEMASSVYSIRVKQDPMVLAKTLFDDHGMVVRPFTTLGLNNLRVSPNVFTTTAQIDKLIDLANG